MPVKGGVLSPAHQAAMVEAARRATAGVPKTAEHKAKLSAALVGREITPEARKKLAAKRRGTHPTPATLDKLRGRRMSPEARAKASASLTGRRHSPEHRARISAARTAAWAALPSDARREMVGAATYAAARAKPSSIELAVRALLEAMAVEYVPAFRIGPYTADVFIPSRMLVVECDGEYWHRNTGERDRARDAYMAERGYKVLRLPEPDIRSGRAHELLKEVI